MAKPSFLHPVFKLIITILFYGCFQVNGQHERFEIFNSQNGLPSDNVFYIFSDSKGYLWFGTDKGVSRFNGLGFKTFSILDGLPDNNVFVINEDSSGRIWFSTYGNELCYLLNDSIHDYVYNDTLRKYLLPKSVKFGLYFDPDGSLFLGDSEFGLVKMSSDGHYSNTIGKGKNIHFFGTQVLKSRNQFTQADKVGFRINFDFFNKTTFDTTYTISYDHSYARQNQDQHYFLKTKDSSLIIINGGVLVVVKDGVAKFSQHSQYFISLFEDDDHRIWMGTRYNGVFVFSNSSLTDTAMHLLDGYSITHINRDFQHGTWISTLEGGVFHLPSYSLEDFVRDLPKRVIRNMIHGPDSTLFILFEGGDVYAFDRNNSSPISSFNERLYDEQNVIHFNHATKTLFTKSGIKEGPFQKSNYTIHYQLISRKQQHLSRSRNMIQLQDGSIYQFNTDGVVYGLESPELIDGTERIAISKINDFAVRNDTIWMACGIGLYYITHKSLFKTAMTDLIDKEISAIEMNDSLMVFGLGNNGVLVRSKNFNKHISAVDGFPREYINDVLIDDSTVWVGTDDHLFQVKVSAQTSINKISSQHANLNSGVRKILRLDDVLVLGTDYGLVTFDLKSLYRPIARPRMHIAILNQGSKTMYAPDAIQFNHDENDIDISLDAISFTDNRNIVYSWKWGNDNQQWKEVERPYISFKDLDPGTYEISARCAVLPGEWSEVSQLSFTVLPPFWLTWWFILLEALAAMAMVFTFYKLRTNQIKKTANERVESIMEMSKLELKALRAQMNPHFIFNALNSIRYLIIKKDNDQAEVFLSKFSTLMRNIINQSPQSIISLQDEIHITTTYIELESLRFSDKFEFSMHVSPDINQDQLKVPGLILQPFVENAIIHGLLNSSKKGSLTINIEMEGEFLKVVIEDNGIGRQKATAIKKSKGVFQQSIGMSNSKNRLDLYNKASEGEGLSMIIEDLKNQSGEALGTRITLNLIPL